MNPSQVTLGSGWKHLSFHVAPGSDYSWAKSGGLQSGRRCPRIYCLRLWGPLAFASCSAPERKEQPHPSSIYLPATCCFWDQMSGDGAGQPPRKFPSAWPQFLKEPLFCLWCGHCLLATCVRYIWGEGGEGNIYINLLFFSVYFFFGPFNLGQID